MSGAETGSSRFVAQASGSFAWRGLRGRPAPDIDVVISDSFETLISARLLRVLVSEGFTGWKGTAVEFDLCGEGAFLFSVTGISSEPADNFHDAHVKESKAVEEGPWWPHHACWDPAPQGWSGEDIFQPRGTMVTVTTHRVKEAILSAGLVANFTEVGRWVSPLPVDEAHQWRLRTGVHPGTRPGAPYCPELLARYDS